MLGTTLLILTAGRDASALSSRAHACVEACFAGSGAPQIRSLTAQEFLAEPAQFPSPTAAWLLAGPGEPEDATFELSQLLFERSVPAAADHDELVRDGHAPCRLDAAPQTLWATLTALLASAGTVHTLNREVKMLRVQSQGIAGQFDKIDEELRMALKIQREFLPKRLPDTGGLAFDVLWRPACYVGGDIYDVVRLDEDRVGVFIADAVGHGMPAALVTIFIKQSIRMREITPGIGPGYRILPPGEALATLNRAMIEFDAGNASLGTAAYGVIDTKTQRLTIARAGHPAPLLLRGDGQTQWLEPDGAMLGILPDEVFEEQTFDLNDGDRFLLYSDGFEVAFPGCSGKGKIANDHFTQEFEGLRRGSGQQALEYLQSRLDLQSGSLNQRDDLTVVCASVRANADVQQRRDEADTRRRSVA